MEHKENKKTVVFSKILSYGMHPLVIPTIATLILMFGQTITSSMPVSAKLFFVGVIFLNTLIVPVIFIGLLYRFKIIKSLSLDDRKERIWPMVAVTIGYILCGILLSNMMLAFLIRRFLMAAILCICTGMIVTVYWKVSLHMIAAGGLLAMLILINFTGLGDFQYWIILFTLLTGALASARLYLGKHSPEQIAAGFFGGFLLAGVALLV